MGAAPQDQAPGRGEAPYGRYLAYLQAGQLAYQYSTAAARPVFFPRVRCPYSGRDCLEWRVSQGRGTVYSTSVVYPRKGEPYNVALIDLDEGFRMMSRVVDVDPHAVRIGHKVAFRVAQDPEGGDPVPEFTLLEQA